MTTSTRSSRRVSVRAASAAAVAAAVAVPVLVGPAAASTADGGRATSSISVATLQIGNQHIDVGTVGMLTSTLSQPVARIKLVPATGVPAVVVTPANSPKSAGGQMAALPNGLGSLSAPALNAVAVLTKAGPRTKVDLTGGSGTASVLGLPLTLGSAVGTLGSSVTSTAVTAGKEIKIDAVALPTLLDLLKKLGIDLNNLPVDTLQGIADSLASTVGGTLKTASASLDTVNKQVDAARTQLTADQKTKLPDLQQAVTDAKAALQAGLDKLPASALVAVLGSSSPIDVATFLGLPAADQTALDALTSADLTGLTTSVTDAQGAVTALQTTIDELITTLQGLVSSLTDAVDAVVSTLTDALNKPLTSLGNLDIVTKAVAGNSPAAVGDVKVGSVHVLGVAGQLNTITSQLTSVVGPVLDKLNALSSLAGVAINLKAPTVSVATVTKSASTALSTVTVTPLSLTLPAESVTLPTGALPGSLSDLTSTIGALSPLPALSANAVKSNAVSSNAASSNAAGSSADPAVSTPAVSLGIAPIEERAAFHPGSQATGSSARTPSATSPSQVSASTGSLASTGMTAALPLTGLVLLGVAILLRRRSRRAA